MLKRHHREPAEGGTVFVSHIYGQTGALAQSRRTRRLRPSSLGSLRAMSRQDQAEQKSKHEHQNAPASGHKLPFHAQDKRRITEDLAGPWRLGVRTTRCMECLTARAQ